MMALMQVARYYKSMHLLKRIRTSIPTEGQRRSCCPTRLCDKTDDISDGTVTFCFRKETGIATMAMGNPPVNSIDLPMLKSMIQRLDELEEKNCKGMVLTSNLGSVFSAGLDLHEMINPKKERLHLFWSSLQDVFMKLYGCGFPTVAVINGHAPAAGCLLALCCDYRVMVGPKYTIGLNEAKLGIYAPKWFQDTLKNTIGHRDAELCLITGKLFDAMKACEMGLIDDVASCKDEALCRADVFLLNMKNISRDAQRRFKLALRDDVLCYLCENRQKDLDEFIEYVMLPSTQAALKACLSDIGKRKCSV